MTFQFFAQHPDRDIQLDCVRNNICPDCGHHLDTNTCDICGASFLSTPTEIIRLSQKPKNPKDFEIEGF
jgi:predicted amidophosphoribosyltransferase